MNERKENKIKMRKSKTQKGITLIALIITIVVLLILAAVAISSITNDGILSYAQNAATDYNQAVKNEQDMLDNYLDYLDRNTPKSGKLSDIVTAKNYGDSIEYSANGITDWKIFYNDGNNVYIIASDYLPNDKFPMALKIDSYNTYGACWETTDSFTSENSAEIDTARATQYGLNWLPSTATDKQGARVTADLMNDAWDLFADSDVADSAIGGPTLEMWVKSWNAKGYTNLKIEYNNDGYYVGTVYNLSEIADENDVVKGGYSVKLKGKVNEYADTLYFPYTSIINECQGYWLSSPSANNPNFTMDVNCNGFIGYGACANGIFGIRPIVCLNSEVIGTLGYGTCVDLKITL